MKDIQPLVQVLRDLADRIEYGAPVSSWSVSRSDVGAVEFHTITIQIGDNATAVEVAEESVELPLLEPRISRGAADGVKWPVPRPSGPPPETEDSADVELSEVRAAVARTFGRLASSLSPQPSRPEPPRDEGRLA